MLTLPRPEGLLAGPGLAYNHYALGIFQPAKVGNFQPAQTGEFSTGVDTTGRDVQCDMLNLSWDGQ
jgi:hypothetical protein